MANIRNIFGVASSLAKGAMRKKPPIATTVALVAGAAAAAGAAFLTHKVDHHRRNTQFGSAHVLNVPAGKGDWLRMLIIGNVCQSATYHGSRWNELPFEYYRAFDRMLSVNPDIKTVLMIGGGGFSYPKHLITQRPRVMMDVVEADRNVISLALEYFYLDILMEEYPDRIRVFEDDGLNYLTCTTETYDAIINDAFAGSKAVANLATPKAIALAKDHLSENGVYLANTVAYPQSNDYADLATLVSSLETCFKNVWVISSTDEEFSDEENYLVVASDVDHEFPEAIPFSEC